MEYQWQRAQGQDVPDIVAMAQDHFETEADTIWATDPHIYAYNVAMTVVSQMYNPWGGLLMAARDANNKLIAYMWAARGERAVWSADEMVTIRIAHVDLSLPLKTRIRLIQDMIAQWEAWAVSIGVPVICSTTMRGDQTGFLRIHQRAGYSIRGSIAYKRLG
jgi:hypothetical protein